MLTNCYVLTSHVGPLGVQIYPSINVTPSVRFSRQGYRLQRKDERGKGFTVEVSFNYCVDIGSEIPRVNEADIVDVSREKNRGPIYELGERSTADVTLLLVETCRGIICATENSSRPHFKSTIIFPGAHGPGLLLQAGRYDSAEKSQLFRLRKGESILFFDTKKEVTKVTAQKAGEPPILKRATSGEVAKYVLEYATKNGNADKLKQWWCFYALKELGCNEQIEAFLQIFPSCKKR